MMTWNKMRPRNRWLVVVAGVVIVVGLLTTTAKAVGVFGSDDEMTGARCARIVKNTKALVTAQAAKIVTDRAHLWYMSDCDSLDPGGLGGVTSDSPVQIRARMRALGDVREHTDADCAEQLGKGDDVCRYLTYRPRGQDRTYYVHPVTGPNTDFSIALKWDKRDY